MLLHRKVIILCLVFFLAGCSHLTSGQYVQLNKGEGVKSLSKEFSIPTWKIEAVNKGHKFQSGDWVFIPLERGILGKAMFRKVASAEYVGSGDFIWPVPSRTRVSSSYGRRWGKKHEGIDIPAPVGTHILSVASGVVVYVGNGLGGYGNLTVISHGDGLFSVYAHAQKNFTKKGQRVHQGEVIARVGMTGRTSGPHLHFELRHNGKALNPQKLLTKN